MLQRKVVIVHDLAQALGEVIGIEQLAEADAATRDLVLVTGADTTAGGADGLLAAGNLAGLIQRDMVGQDQRAGFAEADTIAGRNAVLLQHFDLLQQGLRRQHDAIADQAQHAFAQHARGNQVQYRGLAVDDQGMAGIVATLKAHHGLGAVGQQIDDLALAFITPLGTDYDYILCHFLIPRGRPIGRRLFR